MASYTYFALDLGDEHALGCKCCRFSSGTDLPIPKKLTKDEISALARKFSHQIFADWTKLNAILKRYEEVVQRRWMRKSAKQRRAILLQAWPDMAPTHRPDFVGFRKAFKNSPRSRTMLSKSYLWPYINLEDLLQRHLLLLFINSRGRNLPDGFISMDIEAAHLGKDWACDAAGDGNPKNVYYDPKEHAGLVIMELHGAHDPCSYGRTFVGGEQPLLKKSAMKHHSTLGLLGLEIQQGTYAFLLECVKLILHDIEPSKFFTAPHEPAPPVPQQSLNDWPSFSVHTREAPYRVPQILDLERIKNVVEARRGAAEDHLWLLYDDPGYFLDTLKDWKEHNAVTIKHSCSNCYNNIAVRMISNAFIYFYCWDHILRCLERLPPVEEQLKRADHELLTLPPEEEVIWAEILEVVDWLQYEPITELRIGVPASPRLRHCFKLPEYAPVDPLVSYTWLPPKSKISDAERRVTGLVFALVDSEQRHLHSLNHIIQEFQYMLDTDQAASDLIDPWINSQIADLALLSELKLRIEGLQPWQSCWKGRKIHKTGIVKRHVDDLIRVTSTDTRDLLYCICLEVDFELFKGSFEERLTYPAARAHTKANVTQMRRAEKALADFWLLLDDDMQIVLQRPFGIVALMQSRMSEPRKKHRTPVWKEPAKSAVTSKDKPVLQDRSANAMIAHAILTAKPKVSLPTPKSKVKTRGVPSSTAIEDPEPDTPTPDDHDMSTATAAQTIPVSRRAFRALNALLPAPTSTSHQRAEVAWNELLSAMDEIGLQPEKLYGSVWVFKPCADGKCKVDVTRSISFHEPKEVRRGHKIPTKMVRTFGRRLKHAYGWVDGMFVCE